MFRRKQDHAEGRADERPIPPELRDRLPVDPATSRPLPPRAQPGYYPGYHVLSQQGYWDEATRDVVLRRVHDVPPIRFFTADEAALLAAICDRLVPQDDRDEEHTILIVPAIDARLYHGIIDGYRYDDMPPDGEAYQLGLQGIEAIARHLHNKAFRDLGPREQDETLRTIHRGQPPAGDNIWRRLPPDRFWLLLLGDAVGAYYAHPYAWDEVGFGGPAYPRGYMRLEGGRPEPWEVDERRYEWDAPPTALSDEHHPLGGAHPGHAQPSGQAGTH